ncbi:MAG: LysR substrate-binding domain-containing protein, partial [Deltaproteobacteria bacterium]|nr:LysR substrate-binding domain-containing protein [Deltaproteobacteria bacterium]
AGEELVHRAERILAEVDGINEAVDEIKGLKKGKLSVGGSALAAASFLPVIIQAFKKNHPGVDVTLRIQGSESLQKQLLDGDLELAVVARAPHSPLLFSELYREEEVVVIAPPNHPLARKHSISLELLARERFVVSKKDSQMRDTVERIFAGRGLPFIPSLELDILFGGRDAIKNAVANGIGISVISKSYVDSDLKTGRLKVLKVPELKFKRTMYITVHKDRQNSPLVQVFKAFLRKYNK